MNALGYYKILQMCVCVCARRVHVYIIRITYTYKHIYFLKHALCLLDFSHILDTQITVIATTVLVQIVV